MEITFDKKRYPESTDYLMAWGGFIPIWIVEWNLRKAMGVDVTLFDHLDTQYEARACLGIKGRRFQGEIDSKGILRHPEDPPMHPFMTWETAEGSVYFYPYSVMGIPTAGNHYLTRMD